MQHVRNSIGLFSLIIQQLLKLQSRFRLEDQLEDHWLQSWRRKSVIVMFLSTSEILKSKTRVHTENLETEE